MTFPSDWLVPAWPAPPNVRAVTTTRGGGVSVAPYDASNLGDHVGDDPVSVARNRAMLRTCLPQEPFWLKQVHGTRVIEAEAGGTESQEADGSFTCKREIVCAVLTADCLPVLFCDVSGTVVAAAHAGWRGLAAGVLEQTVLSMNVPTENILAWLGPAIGPEVFEVGDEVCNAFVGHQAEASKAFSPKGAKWLADIYQLARLRLSLVGISRIYGGGRCTFTEAASFYSYRRDGKTGRMASMIWMV